jgi:hypothetical protein
MAADLFADIYVETHQESKFKISTLQLILGFNLRVEVWLHAFLKCRHQI